VKKRSLIIFANILFFVLIANLEPVYSNFEVNLMKVEDGNWQIYPLPSGSSCAGFSSPNLDIIIFANESKNNIIKIILKKEQKVNITDQVRVNVNDPSFFSAKKYDFKSQDQNKQNQTDTLFFIADTELIEALMKGREFFLYFAESSHKEYDISFRIPLKGSMLAINKALTLDRKIKASSIPQTFSAKEVTPSIKQDKVSKEHRTNEQHKTRDMKIKPGYAQINFQDVKKNIGKKVALVEKIIQVSVVSSNGNIYFNIGGRYPNQKLNLVVFSKNAGIFANPYLFEENSVLIHGTLSLYKDKPQIIINNSWQLEIID